MTKSRSVLFGLVIFLAASFAYASPVTGATNDSQSLVDIGAPENPVIPPFGRVFDVIVDSVLPMDPMVVGLRDGPTQLKSILINHVVWQEPRGSPQFPES